MSKKHTFIRATLAVAVIGFAASLAPFAQAASTTTPAPRGAISTAGLTQTSVGGGVFVYTNGPASGATINFSWSTGSSGGTYSTGGASVSVGQ